MRNIINIECVFNTGYDAWEVEVLDNNGKVLENVEYEDHVFEAFVAILRDKYEKLGNKVEVNLLEG